MSDSKSTFVCCEKGAVHSQTCEVQSQRDAQQKENESLHRLLKEYMQLAKETQDTTEKQRQEICILIAVQEQLRHKVTTQAAIICNGGFMQEAYDKIRELRARVQKLEQERYFRRLSL